MSDETGFRTVVFKQSPFYDYLNRSNVLEEVADKEDIVESTHSFTEEALKGKELISTWYDSLKRMAYELCFCIERHIRLKLLAHVLKSTLLLDEDIACLKMVQEKWSNSSITGELLHRFGFRVIVCLTVFTSLVAASLSHWLLWTVIALVAFGLLVVFGYLLKWKRTVSSLAYFVELQLNFDSQVRKMLRLIREQEIVCFGCLRDSKQASSLLSYAAFNPSVCFELRASISDTCKALFISKFYWDDADLNLAFKVFPIDVDVAYLEFEQQLEGSLPLSFLKRIFLVTRVTRSRYLRAFVFHYCERSSLAMKELHACNERCRECVETLSSLLTAHSNLQRHCSSLNAISKQWEKKSADQRNNLFAIFFRSAASHLRFALEGCADFAEKLENVPDIVEQSDSCEVFLNTLLNELRCAIASLEDAVAIQKHAVVKIANDKGDHVCLPKSSPSRSHITETASSADERIIMDEVFEACTSRTENKEQVGHENCEIEGKTCPFERVVLNELKNVLKSRRKDMEIREERARQRLYGAQVETSSSSNVQNACELREVPSETMQRSELVDANKNEEKLKDSFQLDNTNNFVMPVELRNQFVKNLQSALSGRFQ
ncbi:Vezatin, adherens junctions transmembrane protein [Trichuris trichiura]|uniref:Vezatin, adherens junctions transmembrane protein n=1 Tax=Trichuris trichiura TaxID=36087 RepID=A0A077Z6U7_TRITR|nr:Vezatin, adherens junctions transmembrane protein [Trichuris trichiura]